MWKKLIDSNNILAGITLKNENIAEQNNMALHVCHDPQMIISNRKDLAKQLHVSLDQFVCANQTHSDHFYEVTNKDAGKGAYSKEDAVEDVDALYTFEKNIVLTAFTADCVPVVFYSKKDGVIGTIHSGWKGTVQSITEKVFTHLRKNKKVDVTNVYVHIGTCLSEGNFEVDQDVANQFAALGYAREYIRYDNQRHKFFINNQAVVFQQCVRSGIPTENIEIDFTCTMDAVEGFSYREDKGAGRHLTFITRK